MSVTFFAEATTTVDLRVFEVRCEDGTVLGTFVGRENAQSESDAHALVCTDSLCQGYGADVDEVATDSTPLPVNMATRNALDVLRAIGLAPAIDDEPYGAMDAAALTALIDAALTVGVNDAALDTIEVSGGTDVLGARFEGRFVDCGRDAGYVSARLGEVRALAVKCAAQGMRVVWG